MVTGRVGVVGLDHADEAEQGLILADLIDEIAFDALTDEVRQRLSPALGEVAEQLELPGLQMAELRVRLQPRARADEVVGERSGAVVIRVSAPPVDGKANLALCSFIARTAGVPRGRVTILHGAGSREKLVRVEGMSEARLRQALGLGE